MQKFCPHCGEDTDKKVVKGPVYTKSVIKREVTSGEVERLWGLLPLPFQIRPFGVVVDEHNEPIAIAAEDGDDRLWELAHGETRMLNLPAPVMPVAEEPEVTRPQTVPDHICNSDAKVRKEEIGQARYGSN